MASGRLMFHSSCWKHVIDWKSWISAIPCLHNVTLCILLNACMCYLYYWSISCMKRWVYILLICEAKMDWISLTVDIISALFVCMSFQSVPWVSIQVYSGLDCMKSSFHTPSQAVCTELNLNVYDFSLTKWKKCQFYGIIDFTKIILGHIYLVDLQMPFLNSINKDQFKM